MFAGPAAAARHRVRRYPPAPPVVAPLPLAPPCVVAPRVVLVVFPPRMPCMNATIECPALWVFDMILLTEPLAAVGAERIQNNTKMITRKPAIFLTFTANHHSSAQGPRPTRARSRVYSTPRRMIKSSNSTRVSRGERLRD